MNVLSFLTPKAETFFLDSDATVRQALEKFDYHRFSVVPLLSDSGEYLSTVSQGDVLRYIKNDCDFDIRAAENTLVADIYKYRPYEAINVVDPIEKIFELSLSQNFIPVVDDRNMFIGIIKRRSVLTYLYENKIK